MALKAFLDKAQTIEVTATDITDREHTYYCITKGCNAQMTLCAVNSKYKPYFRLKSKDIPHLDGCSDIPNDFIHTEYNIHNTQIIDILDCLSTNNDKHNSINTIKQHSIGDGRDKTATSLSTIYRLLRLTNINEVINLDKKVYHFLWDNRCNYILKKAYPGKRIIECMYKGKTSNGYFLFEYPTIPNNKNVYQLRLSVKDKTLHNKISKQLSNENIIAVIYCNWNIDLKDGALYGYLQTKRHIYYPRKSNEMDK